MKSYQVLQWLESVINARFDDYFQMNETQDRGKALCDVLRNAPEPTDATIKDFGLGSSERLAIALAIAPILQPQILDKFFTRNETYDRRFTEFGGIVHSEHSGFLPTGETLLFLLAGDDLHARMEAMRMFDPDHLFAKRNILRLEPPRGATSTATRFSGLLRIDDEFFDTYVLGREYQSEMNATFPARKITTKLEWTDAVLTPETLDQLTDVQDWLEHGATLRTQFGMTSRLRPGYTCLFYGPPGTGKTLTASLLGKESNRDVYRIDLSMVVSKWVGETQKNLARIFDQAEGRGWILFFDEADALFGKRSEANNSNDRFANQEIAFLLQRIEIFDGLAILASNMKDNIDPAFTRRFQSVIHFPIPSALERLRLWQTAIPQKLQVEAPEELLNVASRHEISGGMIINVIQYCAIKAIKRGDNVLRTNDLHIGLKKELLKEGYFPG